jgi:hypothetical protein
LSLADTAEGVALLVKEHKGVKAVSKILGKSSAWVSKHASIAKLTTPVRRILDNELSEDPELLLSRIWPSRDQLLSRALGACWLIRGVARLRVRRRVTPLNPVRQIPG